MSWDEQVGLVSEPGASGVQCSPLGWCQSESVCVFRFGVFTLWGLRILSATGRSGCVSYFFLSQCLAIRDGCSWHIGILDWMEEFGFPSNCYLPPPPPMNCPARTGPVNPKPCIASPKISNSPPNSELESPQTQNPKS